MDGIGNFTQESKKRDHPLTAAQDPIWDLKVALPDTNKYFIIKKKFLSHKLSSSAERAHYQTLILFYYVIKYND